MQEDRSDERDDELAPLGCDGHRRHCRSRSAFGLRRILGRAGVGCRVTTAKTEYLYDPESLEPDSAPRLFSTACDSRLLYAREGDAFKGRQI